MKVGIFGGTFNPVHNGHLITAASVFEKRNLDRIIFIPCAVSPHKVNQSAASPLDRFNMLQIAIENDERFEISDIEIKKGGISYTYLTILELKKMYDKIELIIGWDNLMVFDKWEKPEIIVENAKLVVLRRKGITNTRKNNYFKYAEFEETPIIEISASEIRERIRERKSIKYLTPENVEKYIYEHKLYMV